MRTKPAARSLTPTNFDLVALPQMPAKADCAWGKSAVWDYLDVTDLGDDAMSAAASTSYSPQVAAMRRGGRRTIVATRAVAGCRLSTADVDDAQFGEGLGCIRSGNGGGGSTAKRSRDPHLPRIADDTKGVKINRYQWRRWHKK